jgi:DNA (cytosine-5)-methyltransferase 1
MKFISLFAGIGGLDLGLERAGMECVAQVEIDDFCQKVLTKHWVNVPKFKDVRDVGKHNLPTADLICGGFPCQDVSLAGARKGLEGKRSTLWSEFHRIICEIQPRWIVIENVLGLLSSDNGEFFTKILRELSQSRHDVMWDIIPGYAVGSPQQRERVFIIAHPQSDDRFSAETYDLFSAVRADMAKHLRLTSKVAWNGIEIDRQDETSYTRLFPVPIFSRVVDGFSNRMDGRLKTPGNAVIPQVANLIGQAIMKAETCLTKREPRRGGFSHATGIIHPEAEPTAPALPAPAPCGLRKPLEG